MGAFLAGFEWSIKESICALQAVDPGCRLPRAAPVENGIWADWAGKSSAGLTFGTGVERIGDESLTRSDSGFVHGYIYPARPLSPQHRESRKRPSRAGRLPPLTFD